MISSSLFRVLPTLAILLLASAWARGETAEELIKKGDVHYEKLQAAEALKYYLPAEKLDPDNARLLVRIAREYRHLMSDAPKQAEKVRLGEIAVEYSKRAAALAPKDPEAHLALAISYGKLLPLQGSKEQVNNSRLIKNSADKVIALEPGNDLAWHVLGRYYLVLADVGAVRRALAQVVYGTLPPAKHEDAVRCFSKAIELKPNRLMHYVELGRTYAQMGQDAEARKFITKGLAMQETEKDDPETKERGRQLLAKLR